MRVLPVVSSLIVPVVLSSQTPLRPVDAPLTRVTEIGTAMGEPEYEFGGITNLALLPGGLIVVVDQMAVELRVFDLRGAHRITLGRRGGGPGEFAVPGVIEADSVLRVFDFRQGRVTTYALNDFSVLGTEPITSLGGRTIGYVTEPVPGVRFATAVTQYSSTALDDMPSVLLLRERDGRVDTVARFLSGGAAYRFRTGFSMTNTPFGDQGDWAIDGREIAIADGYAGTVTFGTIGASGAIENRDSVTLPGASRPVTGQDRAAVEEQLRALHERAGRQLQDLQIMFQPRWSIASDVILDGQGTAWVKQGAEGGREVWTGVTRAGVGPTWRFPAGFRLRAIRESTFAGIVADEDGVQRVWVLAPTGPPPG